MKKKVLIFLLLLCISFSSCCVYHPQTADIPLIKKKNDLRIDAGISLVPTIHSTISYGLTDKIAIQVFGSTGESDRQYLHLATGLYKAYENQNVMELYGGFGYGYGDAYKDSHPGNLYGNYQIYFLQYNLGHYSNKSGHLEFGFGIKSGYFHSNLTDRNYYSRGSETGPYISYKENSILLEPMAFFKVGGERLRFSFKAGGCRIFKITNPNNYIPTADINIGLGLNYTPKFK
jgi:hypothetical protein